MFILRNLHHITGIRASALCLKKVGKMHRLLCSFNPLCCRWRNIAYVWLSKEPNRYEVKVAISVSLSHASK
jgi:hypothetical protein